MNIRKVQKEDEPQLAALIRAVFEEHNAPTEGTVYSDPTTDHLYDLFQAERAVLWVAAVNGELVGCCGVYPTEGLPNDTAELVKFYILSKARGIGIGKQLMEKAISSAGAFGYRNIYLESMPEFAKAVSIYQKLGFHSLDSAMGNSGHTSCTIWMLKSLSEE
ncbi:MAG TPA: GNAT family N-acetyltransferase [Saprospiraceae bacterium]|nr:GNAT family N-acetyltransferase [Saprospiraceae bacterium]